MKAKRIFNYLVIFAITFTIIISSTKASPQEVFASEETRVELFTQLADKVTSLYYKEAIVGLEVMDIIYSDPNLQKNIEEQLEKDPKIKASLLARGFNSEKINEIIIFLNKTFPNVESMKNEQDKNMIKRLIETTFLETDESLSFTDYDEDIMNFGKDLYSIFSDEIHLIFDQHFETEEEKINAAIQIATEFIYNGYVKTTYDETTNQYVDLELMVTDKFIEDVNSKLKFDALDENSKLAMNIFLSGLEDTIESNGLSRIYTDLSMVLDLVGTNHEIADTINLKQLENRSITRGEILEILLTSLEIETINYNEEFKDVKADDLYSGYIAKVRSIGIISGYIDNTFRPMEIVKTSEAMSIISRAIEYLNGSKGLSLEEIEKALKDVKHRDKIAVWARESVAKLIMSEIIDSNYDGEFGSDAFISREELINMINKIKI